MKKLIAGMLSACCILLSACGSGNSYPDVRDLNTKALESYEAGEYQDSLTQYAEAMKSNPVDMEAMLGTVKCQMALENYELASLNLQAAIQVDPQNQEIYDLYIELSRQSENVYYARTAVSLAKSHNVQAFLEKVPEAPMFETPEGTYDSRQEVTVTAPEGVEIYIQEYKDGSYVGLYPYVSPITITRGETELTAYCLKDGIPSETVTAQYICDYAPMEVTFTDPTFEQLVRASMNRPSGSITDVDCEQVTNLNSWNMERDYSQPEPQIQTLSDLYWFPNLQTLQLNNQTSIQDYSGLTQCRNLWTLQFSACGLTDISFLANLSSVQYLYLSDNQITDITPISACKNLYYLDISANPVSSLEPIYGLNLDQISVDGSQIADCSVFLNWPSLLYLSIEDCGGMDLSALGNLTQLEGLYLYGFNAPVTDIQFLEKLTNLTNLTIYGLADYSQVEVVKNLSNLKYLYMRTADYSDPSEDLVNDLKSALPNCNVQLY